MVKAVMDIRAKAVILYDNGKSSHEICEMCNISARTLRRWYLGYRQQGLSGLMPKKTGPKNIKTKIRVLKARVLRLKDNYPVWGARRLKYQFNIPASWRTVHSILKQANKLIRVKAKPQPCKRFARHHVDSMWQGDTFQFRIKEVGKVYVTGFTDDCSRYRVQSKAYLDKSAKSSVNCLEWALRKGQVPREIYLDNGKQFTAKTFKQKAKEHGIKLIFGKPYHPRGRGKIEAYHKALYRELITQKRFKSLTDFRQKLRKFDHQYNYWRKQEVLSWQTPATIYFNEKYFNKKGSKIKTKTKNRP